MGKSIYIHGFNGHCEGKTGQLLAAATGQPITCLGCDYSRPFAECLAELEKGARALAEGQAINVFALSLGAFYALQLRQVAISRIIVWNPVILPTIQLAQFLGRNIRFFDGKEWEFTREALYSYATAPDPRHWNNFYCERLEKADRAGAPASRHIVLGDHDELLDVELAKRYWQDHATLAMIHAGHDVEDFSHLRNMFR